MFNYIYIPKAKIPYKMLQNNIANYLFMLLLIILILSLQYL